jgi:AraC-like DNA-binding protein
MKYSTFKPPQVLNSMVKFYWALEGTVCPGVPYVHRTLANASPELIFHYKGPFEELNNRGQPEKTFLTGVHAQTSKVRKFTAKSDFGIFGVFLQPYAIPILFGIPTAEITDKLPDLSDLLGQEGDVISARMLTAQTNEERVAIINRFFCQRLTSFDRPEIVNAVHLINQSDGLVNVRDLAESSCLSQRQFERKFKEHVGFSPKTYTRIVRFNTLLWKYNFENKSLTQIAYDFGFYDQAHFVQDFKEFSGFSPKTYFSGNAKEVFYAP